MPMVQYRQAKESDVRAMARIQLEREGKATPEERLVHYLAGAHHPHLALAPRVFYVALDGDSPIGYIAGHLTRRFDCDGELQWIYVVPECRRSGVATELLRLLAAWFAGQDATRICVNVGEPNLIARRFYTRHGAEYLAQHWLVWNDIGVVLGAVSVGAQEEPPPPPAEERDSSLPER